MYINIYKHNIHKYAKINIYKHVIIYEIYQHMKYVHTCLYILLSFVKLFFRAIEIIIL